MSDPTAISGRAGGTGDGTAVTRKKQPRPLFLRRATPFKYGPGSMWAHSDATAGTFVITPVALVDLLEEAGVTIHPGEPPDRDWGADHD